MSSLRLYPSMRPKTLCLCRPWERPPMGDADKIPGFESLSKKEYERNAGRIADVENLNRAINMITKRFTTEELIEIFNKATIPISKVNTIEEWSRIRMSTESDLAKDQNRRPNRCCPPPYNLPYLNSINRTSVFLPDLENRMRRSWRVVGV